MANQRVQNPTKLAKLKDKRRKKDNARRKGTPSKRARAARREQEREEQRSADQHLSGHSTTQPDSHESPVHEQQFLSVPSTVQDIGNTGKEQDITVAPVELKRKRGRPKGSLNKPVPIDPIDGKPIQAAICIARASGTVKKSWRPTQLDRLQRARRVYEKKVLGSKFQETWYLTWANTKSTQTSSYGRSQKAFNDGNSLDSIYSSLPTSSTLALLAMGIDGIATNMTFYESIAAKRPDLGLFLVLCMQQDHELGVLGGSEGPFGDNDWCYLTVSFDDLADPEARVEGGWLHELFSKWSNAESGRSDLSEVHKRVRPALNRGRGGKEKKEKKEEKRKAKRAKLA